MDLRELKDTNQRRHPWETSRVLALKSILRGAIKSGLRVLDMGCGDGFVSRELFEGTDVKDITGVDISLTKEQIARFSKAGGAIRYFNGFPPGGRPYDLILLLDVIEHTPDDRAFLSGIIDKRLARGGRVMITAPAFNLLFSSHDRFLGHYRRYSLKELAGVAENSGLRRVSSGYLYPALLLPSFFSALAGKVLKSSFENEGVGNWRHGRAVTLPIELFLRAGNWAALMLLRLGVTVPGLTVWMLCEKRR
ncbi:MAG: class I SAM-dependent methyltransferase [Deltaproteobacteria bacterium]|nr:class I SAM-dependent methyltransferase [Deltaproteobacteria bacterium]